ncbi:uncharacterized protein LOC143474601 [Brachyhypopomus gauderio]|uniref:uncharacterized protein LOC143474601 n=1 Tax=Brachyhypopomus gauderio TaxID=698409 RepID=UPI004042FF56
MQATVFHCLFVVMLSSATCQLSSANPTGARSSSATGARSAPTHLDQTTCKGLALSLLWNVTEALAVGSLFRGLNCTEQSAELYLKTRMLSVCVPQQQSRCSQTTDFTFDQDKCLMRIMEDLRYYRETFKAYSDPDHILDHLVIRRIEDLMQNCFDDTLLGGLQSMTTMEQENSFEGRLKLCKALKGFQIRTITINRVLNHILTTSINA